MFLCQWNLLNIFQCKQVTISRLKDGNCLEIRKINSCTNPAYYMIIRTLYANFQLSFSLKTVAYLSMNWIFDLFQMLK